MFTLSEIEEDPGLSLELKEEVREEAETIGVVTNVVLFDVSWVWWGGRGERRHDRLTKEG